MRVRRRATDRLLSLIVQVHRYRCTGFGCQWEGALRNRGCAATTGPRAARAESLNAMQPEIPPEVPSEVPFNVPLEIPPEAPREAPPQGPLEIPPAPPPAPPPDPALAAWRKAMGREPLKK